MQKSQNDANTNEQIYIAMYGRADINPVSLMLNLSTPEKYLGRSVIIVK